MLADQVLEFPKSPYAAVFGPQAIQQYGAFADKVASAPRFELMRDAVFVVESLSRTVLPSRIHDALNLCRLPYPRMWIDFTFKDRSDWVAIAVKEGRYHQDDWQDEPDAPQRLGFLVEQLPGDENRIMVHPVWNFHHTPILNFCAQSLEIDLEPRDIITPSQSEIDEMIATRGKNSWAESWQGIVREEIACLDIQSRITMGVPIHQRAVMSATYQAMGQEGVDQMLKSAIYDLSGEWKFIMALLMVINSRNVVQYGDEVNFDKLNKQRAKKGKPPLLSHRPITLHLSRVQGNRMKSGGYGRGDVRPHLVRGHWKLRKTGLFFWSSHGRAKGGEEEDAPSYRVRA